MSKLSVVVLTHNDEERIIDCLECLTFADEIIVIDDNSTDRTVEIARKYTKKVIVRSLRDDFASQRNFALNNATCDWVLFIDSDEFISPKLKEEILREINSNKFDSFRLKRIDMMWGQKILHGEVGEIKLLRLAKNKSGKWHGKVHEKWKTRGKIGLLSFPLIHVPHQSVREFVLQVDTYTTLRANELKASSQTVGFIQIILYPVVKFFVNYILKKGYKDGIAGLIYATIMSFHSFLVRSKLYQLNHP